MSDVILIILAAIACYAFVAYLEHKKKIDLIDRGLWKPEQKKEKPENKLITGFFFLLLGAALLIGSSFVEQDLTDGLLISGLMTVVAGITLMLAYFISRRNSVQMNIEVPLVN
jgi:NhaP-type Na+/H+ or K+/H+ antiporter